MLGHLPFYHRTIRKYVTLFGSLFNDITYVRETTGRIQKERQKCPIAYSPKEKFITRLRSDPTLTKSIATTLPRISFELVGMQYDESRKQQSTIRHRAQNTANNSHPQSQYIGVPYNFDFSVSVYVRNIEDGLQIIEQILPFFLPDYTISAQVSQEVDIIKDIPIILKSVTEKIDYEGAFADGTRLIMWDLDFSLKGWLFGPVSNTAIIMGVSANVADANAAVTGGVYVNIYEDVNNKTFQKVLVSGGTVNFKESEPITVPARSLTGTVYSWANTAIANTLYVSSMTGVLHANDEIWGLETGAHWTVQSIEVVDQKDVEIRIYQKPITANQDSDYGYTTFITEFPNTLV